MLFLRAWSYWILPRCFVILPVCPSITDILQINKAAATPSVTMGTWVLWDAAFSTVWISIGSRSIACNNVSPEETDRDKLQNKILHTLNQRYQWFFCCYNTRSKPDTDGEDSQSTANHSCDQTLAMRMITTLVLSSQIKGSHPTTSFCSRDAKENAKLVT